MGLLTSELTYTVTVCIRQIQFRSIFEFGDWYSGYCYRFYTDKYCISRLNLVHQPRCLSGRVVVFIRMQTPKPRCINQYQPTSNNSLTTAVLQYNVQNIQKLKHLFLNFLQMRDLDLQFYLLNNLKSNSNLSSLSKAMQHKQAEIYANNLQPLLERSYQLEEQFST